MLLVIASDYDATAARLVARWAPSGAALLTCHDLSVAGWRWSPGEAHASLLVAGGRLIPSAELTGVLTRLPAIFPQELQHIVAADRAYVAAEMTAFLRAWLADLTCPVLNRPTPTCLSGPGWRAEYWTAAAARLGLPVVPLRRRVAPAEVTAPAPEPRDSGRPSTTITVVGERCFGTTDDALARQAQRLAAAAGVDLLGLRFEHAEAGVARFAGATLWPPLTDDDIVDAVLSYLQPDAQRPMRVARGTPP